MAEKKDLLFGTFAKYALRFTVVIFCMFVIYKQLSHFNNSALQKELLLSSVKQKGWLLAVVFLLMPVNWLLETKKWQLLLSAVSKYSFFRLLKAVLQGVMVGTVTPWRMGEFVGRAFDMQRHEAVVSFYFSALGGMAQAFVTALFGLFFLPWFYPSNWLIVFSAMVCGALLLAYFFFHKIPFVVNRLPFVTARKLPPTNIFTLGWALLLSFLRYCVYLFQWLLVAYTFAIHDNFLVLAACVTVTLLFQSISPALPFFDLAVRSGISLFVFSNVCDNPIAVLLSTIVVWFINIAIPSFAGIIFFIKNLWQTRLALAAKPNVEHFNR